LADSPIASYLLGLQFVTQENLSTIQSANIPVFAYTVRSYEEMEIALNAGIAHILVSNISDAIQYIKRYYEKY
jgi:glycerophosphoryl diester phosphodiesterase